jgi:ABC-2 type transport system permease protein
VVELSTSLTRGQFAAIANLRWRLFVNSLRTTRGALELASRIVIGLLIAVGSVGGAFGMAAGAAYFISHGKAEWISGLLWTVFVFWQMFPIMATAFTENADSSALLRFPVTYRSYVLISIVLGALDPATVLGGTWLLGIFIGIGLATPALLPWTAVVFTAFALVNLLLARMIFAWTERWLAQRRTREILGIFFLLIMLGVQLIGPLMRQYSGPPNPQAIQMVERLSPVQRALPPGLAGTAVVEMLGGSYATGFGYFALLGVYGTVILVLLNLRLRAQYRGENLSETLQPKNARAPTERLSPGWNLPGLSGAVSAVFEKELRYLRRSGPMLFVLVMPIFMLVVVRAGPSNGEHNGGFFLRNPNMAFPAGVAYAMLMLTNLIYNSFGGDSGGIQFFYASPVRFKQIVLGKNLAHMAVFALEIIVAGLAVKLMYGMPNPDILFATLAGTLFAAPLNLAAGNLLSVYSPKKVDYSTFGRQRASQITVLASLAIQVAIFGLGALILLFTRYHHSYWLSGLIFLVLAAFAFALYALLLHRVDRVAMKRQEVLMAELCRA